jgi:hypothetical protein
MRFRTHPDIRAYRAPSLSALTLLAALLTTIGACGRIDPTGKAPNSAATPAAARATIDLFAFGRVLGTIAPCGCTTEPLGGLGYAFGYIEARSTAAERLVLEPGSFLFPDPAAAEAPTDEASWSQAEARADLLHRRFSVLGDRLVSGLGPTDLSSAQGSAALARWLLPRTAVNAGPALELPKYRLLEIDAVKIAVTSAIDPELAGERLGPLEPLEPALTRELIAMRGAGADLVVVMLHGKRPRAEALARALPGIDVMIVGVVEGVDRTRLGSPPARIGDTWILEPGEQAQTITHLRLSIDRKLHPKGVPSPAQWSLRPPRASREAELTRVQARLDKFKADPSADPSFIRRLEEERATIKSSLEGPDEPTEPVAVTFDQVKVTCKLPVDDAAIASLRRYDAWVAEQNMQRFAGIIPPPPADGEPGFVGVDECEACHEEAVTFWRTTRHARAFATLVDDNKQYDLSCVGCHVTGFRRPGGSEVVENEHLRDIQCEQCHGPASLHVQEPTVLGRANAIRRASPIELCLECHTPEHSDTFQYEAYLRDVLGEGHGVHARIALGDGPTGRELRAAGFAKAGGACKKMPAK